MRTEYTYKSIEHTDIIITVIEGEEPSYYNTQSRDSYTVDWNGIVKNGSNNY